MENSCLKNRINFVCLFTSKKKNCWICQSEAKKTEGGRGPSFNHSFSHLSLTQFPDVFVWGSLHKLRQWFVFKIFFSYLLMGTQYGLGFFCGPIKLFIEPINDRQTLITLPKTLFFHISNSILFLFSEHTTVTIKSAYFFPFLSLSLCLSLHLTVVILSRDPGQNSCQKPCTRVTYLEGTAQTPSTGLWHPSFNHCRI